MSESFLASEIRLLTRLLDQAGIDSGRVLRESGIDPRLAEQPRARYPFDRVIDAWVRGAEMTGDPDFSLRIGKAYRATDLHGLAISFLASSDLATALARIARYHKVVNTVVKTRYEGTADRSTLFFSTIGGSTASRRMQEDSRSAILADLARQGLDSGTDPVEVRFTYPEPADRRELDALLRCRLVFDAAEWCIAYGADDSRRPFLASNREIAQSHDAVLDGVLKSLRRGDLVSRVQLAMVEQLASGTPSEHSVARAVSLSTRSLQRRLAEERTSFTDLLTTVRRDLAEKYVRDRDLAVTEISYMLGFSDVSSFSRAFKRWTGKSPVALRREAVA